MSLWAIIPVKPLRRGKSRLSSVLTEDERAMLNYSMLSNVLLTLRSISQIDQILVVSRDTSALSLAREYGVRTVQEDGRPNLNTALKRATAVAQIYSVDNILVLPADLPLITSQDIENIIKKAGDPPVMVIAPDRRMDGTNALYVSPAGTIEYSYGPGSFRRHIEQAKINHMRTEICDLPTLSLDLDWPEDLELLKQIQAMQVDI